MTMCEFKISELLSFLSLNTRLDVKCTAVGYVLGLTGSKEGKEWIRNNRDILEKLLNLLDDQNEAVSKDAHEAIVNISADQEMIDCLSASIPLLLSRLKNPQWMHADKLCTIISNLSHFEVGARRLFKVLTEAEEKPSVTFYQLVDIFDRWKSYNKSANFHHLAGVFLNLSQVREARRLFLDQSKCILPKLLPYTQFSGSHVRRCGIAGLLKNLCFEDHYAVVDHHQWLLGEEADVLSSLLLPLAGPEQFEEEEMDKLPEDLQYLPDDKERESDPNIRRTLLEALMKLCCTKHGREFFREKQVYLILRELHKWEKEEEVKGVVENLVHILISDEPGIDNLEDIKLEDSMGREQLMTTDASSTKTS